MKNIGLYFAMVGTTVVLFLLVLVLNEWMFSSLEFARGINWIYLPAGVRLLCTLLFAEAGAVGLLLASWLVCFFYFFPHDWARAFMGGIAAALAPYLSYRLARSWMGFGHSLNQLTASRLLLLSLVYAVSNALMHQLGILLIGRGLHLDRVVALLVGDLLGTLIVLYLTKLALSLWRPQRGIYELR